MKSAIKPNRLLTMAGFVVVVSLSLAAGDIRIIANPSVKADTISARDLRSVFLLQRKTLPDGSPVLPVLQKSGQIHEAFLKRHLDRGSDELQTYYQGLVFTGKGSMPKQVTSDAEAVAYVAQTKGAIGYVSASAATPGVKTLLVDTGAPSQDRTLVQRVQPEYPETLRQMRIGGSVRLLVTVSPSGAVQNVEILGGNPILAEAAVDAVKRWVYVPAPSKTELQVTIPFEPRR